MPDLRAFADFARETALFPLRPGVGTGLGTEQARELSQLKQCINASVPAVPAVPRQNDTEMQQIDWRAFFDERAGIREYDGGLARRDAERLAYADTMAALGHEPGTR